ncbi:MAG TPA: hypothetical protein VGO62_04585, partial [Myxococcota bacterium]
MRSVSVAVAVAVAFAALSLAPTRALAIEAGGECTLKSPLQITIKRPAGVIESSLDQGAAVEVISVGDSGIAIVRSGEVKGGVSLADLESACAGALRSCTLSDNVMMYEENRSDSRSWRVKAGADVSVLKRGKTWAAVRVGDLQGFVKADELAPACRISAEDAPDRAHPDNTSSTSAASEAVDRGDGPGLLVLPFSLEDTAPAGAADALLETLFERVQYYRPDAGRLGADPGDRSRAWKDEVAAAARRARGADLAYALVGRLAVTPPSADAPLTEHYLLQLAIVDAKSGKVLKGVRVKPTMQAQDTWAERSLGDLLPALAAAPGSKLPTPSTGAKLEVAADPQQPAVENTGPKIAATQADTPWFENGWGYVTLAGAVVAGAGSGLLGQVALDENDRANAAIQVDKGRATLRNTALTEAITADSLGVVGAGLLIGTVVVFATRSGM